MERGTNWSGFTKKGLELAEFAPEYDNFVPIAVEHLQLGNYILVEELPIRCIFGKVCPRLGHGKGTILEHQSLVIKCGSYSLP